MTNYTTKPFNIINNREYRYYKLYVDNVCQFDEFYEQIKDKIQESKYIKSIISLMDQFGDHVLYPRARFRHIIMNRDDVFEFKKKTIRVYVIKQKPYIYVVMGGFKKNQKFDIALLYKRIKGFKEGETK